MNYDKFFLFHALILLRSCLATQCRPGLKYQGRNTRKCWDSKRHHFLFVSHHQCRSNRKNERYPYLTGVKHQRITCKHLQVNMSNNERILKEDHILQCQDAFTQFSNKSGLVATKDLGNLLRSLGINPTNEELQVRIICMLN